jgi:diacylglycerol kinase family enzyme
MTAHVQLITNPDAGSYRAAKIEALRHAFSRHGAKVTLTHCGPGRDAQIAEDADLIVVAGGDGTLRHVAIAALARRKTIPIACFPMGTVNLLHLEQGGPASPEAFAKAVMACPQEQLHVPASINGHVFLACASIGPDSRAVANVSLRLKSRIGRYAYGMAMLAMVPRWKRSQLTLIIEGQEHRCEAVYIAKGTYFAGPYSFAPDARRTRPMLHVVVLKSASRLEFIRFVLALVRGRSITDSANILSFECTAFDVHGDADLPVQADGDVIATVPARIEISDQRLSFH